MLLAAFCMHVCSTSADVMDDAERAIARLSEDQRLQLIQKLLPANAEADSNLPYRWKGDALIVPLHVARAQPRNMKTRPQTKPKPDARRREG